VGLEFSDQPRPGPAGHRPRTRGCVTSRPA